MAQASFQQFLTGHTITSRQGIDHRTYHVPERPPATPRPPTAALLRHGSTYLKSMVIGTQGFAALAWSRPT
jgi:hypothetical protein